MRFILWLGLLLLLVCGVLAPASYLHAASQLPKLENELDLERYLREYVEGERMSGRIGLAAGERGAVSYLRPDFARLPKDLVALYIDGWGCPALFQSPRETGLAWSWRVFSAWTFARQPAGDGRCEWELSYQLADIVGVRGGMKQAIAASRIHGFLSKDQLVAYHLSAITFERGVVGVEEAARALFGKRLEDMDLAELAELELALPPHGYYAELKECRSIILIRQARDVLLTQLSRHGLVSEDQAKSAQAAGLACARP